MLKPDDWRIPPLARARTRPAEVLAPEPEVPVGAEATPLEFLQAVYRDPAQPLGVRLRAATAAAQYVHPKISVVGAFDFTAFGAQLEEAIARSNAAVLSRPKAST